MQTKLAFIVFFVILSSACTQENHFITTNSPLVREYLKDKITKLPPIDYRQILGRKPSIEELELGRNLFNDTVLSRNNDVSCATCHLTNHGMADGNSLSIGAFGKGGPTGNTVGKSFGEGELSVDRGLGDDGMGNAGKSYMFRNALSTINAAYRINKDNSEGLFHDGRFGNLFFQVLLPIHTSIEVCGDNYVPIKNNPFEAGGYYFKEPIKITQSNSFDYFSGKDTGSFNANIESIKGIPSFRPDGSHSIPGRNECLAITIAKLKKIPYYRDAFKKLYQRELSDETLAIPLAMFISTHVSKRTPFDQFLEGKNSLTKSELIGVVSFFTKMGSTYMLGNQTIKGAGCFQCHSGPTFGGKGYASLGVKGDILSPLSHAQFPSDSQASFFGRVRLQRGEFPQCYINNQTISRTGYAPDMGRAAGSFQVKDCFKFRIPPLRNIIETYPYFHHGNARAQDFASRDIKKRAIKALEQVVLFHLRGPVDPQRFSMNNHGNYFFDTLYLKDYFVPSVRQNFIAPNEEKLGLNDTEIFPITLPDEVVTGIVDFIAYGLLDKEATKKGDLENDISHPVHVPSGLSPSISRDLGTQIDKIPSVID